MEVWLVDGYTKISSVLGDFWSLFNVGLFLWTYACAEQAWQGASGQSPAVHEHCWSKVIILPTSFIGFVWVILDDESSCSKSSCSEHSHSGLLIRILSCDHKQNS